MSTVLAEARKTLDSINRLDQLGGGGSLFGREHIFGELLHDEHEKDGLTDNGCYCFKKLNWYGNIVSWEPTLRAIAAFLELGYVREDLEELRDWWSGDGRSIDCVCLASYITSAFKRPDIQALLEKADKARQERDAAEAARLAAIPHTEPPPDAPVYRHKECIEDFAGNFRQPGAWADLFEADDGTEVVTFGGCWVHYVEGDDVLEKFGDGERGCPVESRPNKVKQLKKMSAEYNDDSFYKIVRFLEANHNELRFGEEFRWEKDE